MAQDLDALSALNLKNQDAETLSGVDLKFAQPGREFLAALLEFANYPAAVAAAHLEHFDTAIEPHLKPLPLPAVLPAFMLPKSAKKGASDGLQGNSPGKFQSKRSDKQGPPSMFPPAHDGMPGLPPFGMPGLPPFPPTSDGKPGLPPFGMPGLPAFPPTADGKPGLPPFGMPGLPQFGMPGMPPIPSPSDKTFLTEDHSPVETSIRWSSSDSPQVSYTVDAPGIQKRDYARKFIESTCAGQGFGNPSSFFLKLWDTLIREENGAFWVSWDLHRGEEGTRLGKIYVFPVHFNYSTRLKHVHTNELSLLDMLAPLIPSLGCSTSWGMFCEYISTLPSFPPMPTLLLSVDITNKPSNRLKLYTFFPNNDVNVAIQVMTLGRRTRHAERCAEIVKDFWETLGFDESHGQETFGRMQVCHDLNNDLERTSNIYLPVRGLTENDETAARGIEKFLEKYGMLGWQGYRDTVARVCCRDLAARTGLHTMVSVTVHDGEVSKITAYQSCEVNAVERHKSNS